MTYTADPILNSKKNKLAKAYLYTLIAKLNYAAQESNQDIDGIGVDFLIYNRLVGENRTVGSEAEQINLQLKAVSITSSSMFRKTDSYIEYNLSRDLKPIGPNHYLVIVELLGDDVESTWIEHCEDNILMKKCAYYMKITETMKKGFIKIPKINMLTPETFPSLFLGSKNKENLV